MRDIERRERKRERYIGQDTDKQAPHRLRHKRIKGAGKSVFPGPVISWEKKESR